MPIDTKHLVSPYTKNQNTGKKPVRYFPGTKVVLTENFKNGAGGVVEAGRRGVVVQYPRRTEVCELKIDKLDHNIFPRIGTFVKV